MLECETVCFNVIIYQYLRPPTVSLGYLRRAFQASCDCVLFCFDDICAVSFNILEYLSRKTVNTRLWSEPFVTRVGGGGSKDP